MILINPKNNMNFHIHIRAKRTVYGGNEVEGRATTEKVKDIVC